MDSQSRDDLRRLVRERPGVAGLTGAARPAPVLGSEAIGTQAVASGASTAGIASPLTEPDYGTRTWHAGALATTSTDGTLTILWDLPQQIDMTDANGKAVALVFDAP